MENFKLQFRRKNIERSRPPLDSTSIGAKISDTKTPETDSLARKERLQKDCVSEDPNSDSCLPESSWSNYYLSYNSNYKRRKKDKREKYCKLKKQDPIKLCAK